MDVCLVCTREGRQRHKKNRRGNAASTHAQTEEEEEEKNKQFALYDRCDIIDNKLKMT